MSLDRKKLDKVVPVVTYCKSRRPMLKVHSNMNLAKSAMRWCLLPGSGAAWQDMELFVYGEKGWELMYKIEKGDTQLPWEVNNGTT